IVQDNRDKKKNTDSSAGFHQNQLESICVFYLLASFCPASFIILKIFTWGLRDKKFVPIPIKGYNGFYTI
ncbi:hypothetical protein, partial [Streptococcus suis]